MDQPLQQEEVTATHHQLLVRPLLKVQVVRELILLLLLVVVVVDLTLELSLVERVVLAVVVLMETQQ